MNTDETIQLSEFKSVVFEIAKRTREEFPNLYFDYAGIIPEDDENSRYDSSPTNTKVFSRTGGDGVHYSILELSDKIQPIVMTVPMNFGNSMNHYNWIIGENLNEFLSIGILNGWFPLEQLCYNNKWVIEFYENENSDIEYQNDGDIQFVRKLQKRFRIRHVPLNNTRLKVLEDKYFKELTFKQSFIEKYINKAST